MADDYSDLIAQLPQDDNAVAQGAVVSAQATPPAQATQDIANGQALGLPPQVTGTDPQYYGPLAKAQGAASQIAQSPGLAGYINSDPMAAKVSHDDLGPLGLFMQKAREAGSYFNRGFAEATYNRLAAAHQAGADNTEILKSYESQFQQPIGGDNFLDKAAEFFGNTANSALVAGAPAAAVGAAAGAVSGPGSVFTAAGGFGAGFAADMALQASGSTYRKLELARDKDGNPLPESLKQFGAITSGAVAGALGVFGGAAAHALVEGAVSRTLADRFVQNKIAGVIINAGKAGVTGAALNAGLDLGSTIPQEFAKTVGGNFDTAFNDPKKFSEAVQQLKQSTIDGFELFGAGSLIAAPVIVRLQARQAQQSSAQLDVAFQALDATQTKSRSPDLAAKAAAQHFGDSTISIPADKINEVGPQNFSYVPDLNQKMAEAIPRGGDIDIPTADYLARTAPDVHAAVKDDIKFGDLPSVNEAKDAITAYHGTPYTFENFDTSKIGTGEGAQAYGHGLYFAQNKSVAEDYRAALAGGDMSSPETVAGGYILDAKGDRDAAIKKLQDHVVNPIPGAATGDEQATMRKALDLLKSDKEILPGGSLYQVQINRPADHFIDYDKSYDEQTPYVKNVFAKLQTTRPEVEGTFYKHGTGKMGDALSRLDRKEMSSVLGESGIAGIQYLDQGSRAEGEGSRNLVVFNHNDVKITHRNGEPISPLIESLANEVATQSQSIGAQMLGIEPGALGMNASDFNRYYKHITALQASMQKGVYDAAEGLERRYQTADWKAKRKETIAEVADEFRSISPPGNPTPDRLAADYYLRTGKGPLGETFKAKLLRGDIERRFPELVGDLPDSVFGKEGMDPDDIAGMFGYSKGEDMLRDISELGRERRETGETPEGQFKRLVEAEADKRMMDRYGDLENNIRDRAISLALEPQVLDILNDEMKALGGDQAITKDALRAKVQAGHALMDARAGRNWQKFMNNAGKMARWAEQHLLAGRPDQAFLAKQAQASNIMLAQEARLFDRQMEQMDKVVDRYRNSKTLDNVAQPFTDQIHGLLERFGISTNRSPAELRGALGGDSVESLSKFLESSINERGLDIPIDPRFFDRDYQPSSVDDMRALKDSLTTLDHNGKFDKVVTRGQEKESLDALGAEFTEQVQDLGRRYLPRNPGKIDRLKSTAYDWDASLVHMEQLFDWLDKNDSAGVMNRSVYRGLQEGQYARYKREMKYAEELGGWDKIDGLHDKIDTPSDMQDWYNPDEPMQLSRKDLLAIMLNTGTESNRAKLLASFEHEGVQKQLITETQLAHLEAQMRPEDWGFVQKVWDTYESLWPEVESLSRRLTGLAPDKVDARTITNEHGTFRGGYYPLRADARFIGPGDRFKGVFDADSYFRATPPKGYTKTRTAVGYPLDTNLDNVTQGLREVIHDVSMREPLINAQKVLSRRDVKQGIQNAFGPEYLKQVNPWLEYIANPGRVKQMDSRTLAGANSLARFVRKRIVTTQMLYRMSTVLKHGGSAAIASAVEAGPINIMNSARYLYGNPMRSAERISNMFELSGELATRHLSFDRDIGNMTEQALGKGSWYARFQHAGGSAIAAIDMFSALPTFHAAYTKSIAEGLSSADAAFAADKVVRRAHGSGGLVNLPAIMRANEITKLSTIAYSFFNRSYNRMRDIGRDYAQGTKQLTAGDLQGASKVFSATMRSLLYIGGVAAIESAVSPSKDSQSEGWGEWFAKGLARQVLATIPIVRDAAQFFEGREPSTPTGQVLSVLTQTGKDLVKEEHGEPSPRIIKDLMTSTGYIAGVPGTGQFGASAQFLWDLKQHRQHADNALQLGRGIALGRSNPGLNY